MQTLSSLRRSGKSPALPVFVCDIFPLAANLRDCGAVVVHPRHTDWSELTGLDVILALRSYPRDLARSILACRPRRLQCIDWSARMGERLSVMLPL